MMKTTLAVLAAVGAVCAQAQAYPVTYRLVDTSYNATATMERGLTSGAPLGTFQLTIDSAAVSRGSFALGGFTDITGNNVRGDLTSFISATTPFGDGVSPTIISSTFATSLTFDQTGAVTGGVLAFGTSSSGLTLSGSGNSFTGTFGGDGTRCGANACGVTGRLVTTDFTPASVPEPISMTLLLAGLVGVGIARARD